MDATRFDNIAKLVAARRLSRRQAVRQGGTGLVAAALAAAGIDRPRRAGAQGATPDASPAAGVDLEFLFVQVFERGTFRPKPDERGVYVLALNHSSAQTIYFSNRPARVVGTVPTARFLPTTVPDPPNAALVTRAADGNEDVLVFELLRPTYDEAAGKLAYDVRILENYEEEGLRFVADQQNDITMPESFGQASLFIDDCPDGTVYCYNANSCEVVGNFGSMGHCGSGACCGPCGHPDQGYWNDLCNQTYDACQGNCSADDDAWFACFDRTCD